MDRLFKSLRLQARKAKSSLGWLAETVVFGQRKSTLSQGMLDSGRWDHTRQRSVELPAKQNKTTGTHKHLSQGPGGAF